MKRVSPLVGCSLPSSTTPTTSSVAEHQIIMTAHRTTPTTTTTTTTTQSASSQMMNTQQQRAMHSQHGVLFQQHYRQGGVGGGDGSSIVHEEDEDGDLDHLYDKVFDGVLDDADCEEPGTSIPQQGGLGADGHPKRDLAGLLAHVRLSVLPQGGLDGGGGDGNTAEDGSTYWAGRRLIREELFDEAIKNQFNHFSGIVKLRRLMRMDPRPWNIYYRLRRGQFPLHDDECAALLLWTSDLVALEGTTASGSAIPAHSEMDLGSVVGADGGREPLPALSYHSNPAKIPVWRLGQEVLATREHINCRGLHRGRRIHAIQMGNEMYYTMSGASFANAAIEKNGGEAILSDDQALASSYHTKMPKPGMDSDNAGLGTICAYLRLCEVAGDLTGAFGATTHFLELDRLAQTRSPDSSSAASSSQPAAGEEESPVHYSPNTVLHLLWLSRIATKNPNHEKVEEIVQFIRTVYDERRLWQYTVDGREALSRKKFGGKGGKHSENNGGGKKRESSLVATADDDDDALINQLFTAVQTQGVKTNTFLGASPLLVEQENELFATLYFKVFRKVEGVVRTDPESADSKLLTWIVYQYLRCCVGMGDAHSSAVSAYLLDPHRDSLPNGASIAAWIERHAPELQFDGTDVTAKFFTTRRPPVKNSIFPQLSRSEPLFIAPGTGEGVTEATYHNPILIDSLLKPSISAQLAERAFPVVVPSTTSNSTTSDATALEAKKSLQRAKVQSLLKVSRAIQQCLGKCQEWWFRTSGEAIDQVTIRQQRSHKHKGPITNIEKKVVQERIGSLDMKLLLPPDAIAKELRVFIDVLSNNNTGTHHAEKWGDKGSFAALWSSKYKLDELHRALLGHEEGDRADAVRRRLSTSQTLESLEKLPIDMPGVVPKGVEDLALGLFAERYAAATGLPAEVYHYLLVGLFARAQEAVRDMPIKAPSPTTTTSSSNLPGGDTPAPSSPLPPVIVMAMSMYKSVTTKAGLRLCDTTRGFVLGSVMDCITTLRMKGYTTTSDLSELYTPTSNNGTTQPHTNNLIKFASQVIVDQTRELIFRRRLDIDNECSSAVVSHWAGDYPSLLNYRNAFPTMEKFYGFALGGGGGVDALLDVVLASEIHGKVADKVERLINNNNNHGAHDGAVVVDNTTTGDSLPKENVGVTIGKFIKGMRDDLMVIDVELAQAVSTHIRTNLTQALRTTATSPTSTEHQQEDHLRSILEVVPRSTPKIDLALMGAVPCFENYSLKDEGASSYIATTSTTLMERLSECIMGGGNGKGRRAVYILDASFLESPHIVTALLSLVRSHKAKSSTNNNNSSDDDELEPYILIPFTSLEQVSETILAKDPSAREFLDSSTLFSDGTDLVDTSRTTSPSYFSSRVVIDRDNELQYRNDNPDEIAAVSAALANQHLNACSSSEIKDSLSSLRALYKLLSRSPDSTIGVLHFTECCLAYEATSGIHTRSSSSPLSTKTSLLDHLTLSEASKDSGGGAEPQDTHLLRIAQMVRLFGMGGGGTSTSTSDTTNGGQYDVFVCTDDPQMILEVERNDTMRALSHGIRFVSSHPAVTSMINSSSPLSTTSSAPSSGAVDEKVVTTPTHVIDVPPPTTPTTVREEDVMGVMSFFGAATTFKPVLKDVPIVPLSEDDKKLLGRRVDTTMTPSSPPSPSQPTQTLVKKTTAPIPVAVVVRDAIKEKVGTTTTATTNDVDDAVQLDSWMALLEDDDEPAEPSAPIRRQTPTIERSKSSTPSSPTSKLFPQNRPSLELLLREAEHIKRINDGADDNTHQGHEEEGEVMKGKRILGLESLGEIAPLADLIRRGGMPIKESETREEKRAREAVLRASGIHAGEDPQGRADHNSKFGDQQPDLPGSATLYEGFHSNRPVPAGEYGTQEEEFAQLQERDINKITKNPYGVDPSADARMPVEGGRPGGVSGEQTPTNENGKEKKHYKKGEIELTEDGLPVFENWSLSPLRQDHIANTLPRKSRLHREAKHISNVLNAKVGRKFVVKRYEANVNDPRNKHLVDAFRNAHFNDDAKK